jgi:hypothetical protein
VWRGCPQNVRFNWVSGKMMSAFSIALTSEREGNGKFVSNNIKYTRLADKARALA